MKKQLEHNIRSAQEEVARHIKDVNAGRQSDLKVTTFRSDVDVKKIREKYNMTQEKFCEDFGISLSALRNWEQERRKPDGPTIFLLKLIDKKPDLVREMVKEEKGNTHHN